MKSELAAAFTTALGIESNNASALERTLRAYIDAARKEWPAFSVEDVEFVGFIAARAEGGRIPPLEHAADALLAFACSRGDLSAIRAFQRVHGPVIDRVLAHRRAAAHVADDARQIVEQRLLVADGAGAAAKIAAYRGVGPLKSWVASTAARTLMMLQRSSRRRHEEPERSANAAYAVSLDPELEYLKRRYATDAEEAIVYALDRLTDRDRALLRLHLEQRVSIDVLGSLYSVNRATAARWLAAARRALESGARERLRERLHLSESECKSLVALLNSGLEVSLVRRLAES